MNNSKLAEWRERFSEVNVFEEFDNIIELLIQEYMKDQDIPWVVSFSGGKDSSLVLTLVWKAIQQIPASDQKKKVHVVMSDTAVETPVMQNYQHSQLRLIEKTAKAQELDNIIKVHMVRPPMKSRFFVKIIGKGTPNPTPNAKSRFCTDHLKIQPIQKEMDKIIKVAIQNQEFDLVEQKDHAIVSILGVRLSESQSRASSIRKFETDDLYAQHATDKRIKVMHPIKRIDLDSLWSYLESLPNGEFPYGGSVLEMMKQYGKSGFECGIKDGSEGEGKSCGAAGSRSGCWVCPLMSGEDKMLTGLIEEGHKDYHYLQEWKDYMKSIRNDVRFRLPTQRQKFVKHAKVAVKEQEEAFTLFSNEETNDIHEKRKHLYATFGRATFQYAPGALTIEARKRMLEYLLWIQGRMGITLIENDELEAVLDAWRNDGYHLSSSDLRPAKYTHKERLILRKDGTVNEDETTVSSFPIFYVKVQTQMSESDFMTYVQNKVRKSNKSIPYLSQVLDYEKEELVFNEFIFIVCSPFATTQREAEHHVFAWLEWKEKFDCMKYDPPYEGWEPEDEGIYVPANKKDSIALSKHRKAQTLINHIKFDIDLSNLWETTEELNHIDNYIQHLNLLDIFKRRLGPFIPHKTNSIQFIENDSGQLTLVI